MGVAIDGGRRNPWEEKNRAIKVRDIAFLIWSRLTPTERRNPNLPVVTEQQGAEWWAGISVRTGHNDPPSATTRREVVLMLSRMLEAERAPACTEGDIELVYSAQPNAADLPYWIAVCGCGWRASESHYFRGYALNDLRAHHAARGAAAAPLVAEPPRELRIVGGKS